MPCFRPFRIPVQLITDLHPSPTNQRVQVFGIMKHSFSSLAALALTLSTSVVASPAPQLVVPGILDTVSCLAVNVIVELLVGDPLAIAYCAVSRPFYKLIQKTLRPIANMMPCM